MDLKKFVIKDYSYISIYLNIQTKKKLHRYFISNIKLIK